MRLITNLFILFSLFFTSTAWSATTVTVQKNAAALVNQLVTDVNIVTSVPTVVTSPNPAASQTGILGNATFSTLPAVTMGANGIMLTTGDISGTSGDLATPPATGGLPGDADVFNELAAIAVPLTTGTFDASSLQFNFTVPAGADAISLELVFASNEVIGAILPDAAVIMVDGINYAKLGNGQLLSNQTAGILTATVPPAPQVVTGFAAASSVYSVIARLDPLIPAGGTHSIKIAIADNKDTLVDSAIIVANMTAITSPQSGMGLAGTDFLPPVVTAPPAVTAQATGPTTTVNLGAPVVTDNVDIGLRALPTPAGPYPVGVTVITWTATDAAGNIGTATQTLTVQDTIAPVITPPAANTFSTTSPTLNADITAYLNTVTAVDAVGVVGPITNNAPVAGFPVGTTLVTFTATDAAGNLGIATTTITVTTAAISGSISAPTLAQRLVQPPITFTAAQVLPVGLPVDQTGLVNSTNLGVLLPGPPATSLLLPKQAIMLTTGSINGNRGNIRAPGLPAGGDADVFNALTNNLSFQTTGTFDASTLQLTFTVPAGTPSVSFDLIYATNEAIGGVQFPDAAVVMVDGTNRATFSNGLLLSNLNGAFLTPTLGTLVPGFANVSQVQTLTVVLDPALATHTLKITIADNNDALVDSALIIGNMQVATSNQGGMGVGDVFPPYFVTLPTNVTVEATGALTTANLGAPIVADNVDPNPRAIPSSQGPFPLGITTITWLSTDLAGNVSLPVTTTVNVVDTTPPAVTPPAAATFAATSRTGLPANNAALAAYLGSVTATDAVGVSSITNNAPAVFPIGVTTVTFTATDLFGQTASASTNITVTAFVPGTGVGGTVPVANGIDQIPPVLKLVGSNRVTVLQTAVPTLYADPGATVVDNFDGPTPGVIPAVAPFDTSQPVGLYDLVYTATDAAGNTSTIIRKISIVAPLAGIDVLPPVVTPPLDILVSATSFAGLAKTSPALTAFFAAATAADNIGLNGPVTNNAPALLPVGKTVVTFTARDIQGNVGSADAIITVIGTTQSTGSAVDLDGDFIPDSWEISIFGDLLTAGPATDFDLDTLTDAMERILGTNPKVANTNPSGAPTDAKDVVYMNDPSDTDGDGIIDALEDNSSVLDPTIVTGIPSVTGASTFSIDSNGYKIQSVSVSPATAAPANISAQLGLLSYNVLTPVGATITVRINSTVPFGTTAQFYKVDRAGNYNLIPANLLTVVGANTIDLTLSDGGPLDLDGIVNGVIVDPIAFGSAPQILGGSATASSGGGCTIAAGNSVDPLFPALLLLSLLYLLRSRFSAGRR